MASYEAIKNFDDDDDEDVEMALLHNQISESRSATVSSPIGQTTPLHIHNIIEEQRIISRHQPQPKSPRLVSLDVFRGLTVAVISLLLFPFGVFIPFFKLENKSFYYFFYHQMLVFFFNIYKRSNMGPFSSYLFPYNNPHNLYIESFSYLIKGKRIFFSCYV